jgi:hypothetical protein
VILMKCMKSKILQRNRTHIYTANIQYEMYKERLTIHEIELHKKFVVALRRQQKQTNLSELFHFGCAIFEFYR